MPQRIRDTLISNLEVQLYQVYEMQRPLGRADLMELAKIDRPDLKDPQFLPAIPPELTREEKYLLGVEAPRHSSLPPVR